MKRYKNIGAELKEAILGKFFSIEGDTATLKLVYDTFEELLNLNFGDERAEKLNEKLFSDIKEAIDILPKRYKLNVQIVIKDFGEYNVDECQEIISRNVNLSVYMALKTRETRRWGGLTLVGLGAVVLVLSYFLRNTDYDVLFDIINISGTLFVWEGVNTAFLQRDIEFNQTKKIAKVLKNVSIIKE